MVSKDKDYYDYTNSDDGPKETISGKQNNMWTYDFPSNGGQGGTVDVNDTGKKSADAKKDDSKKPAADAKPAAFWRKNMFERKGSLIEYI